MTQMSEVIVQSKDSAGLLMRVRPWSLLWWFILPSWALLWMATNPPHALDMALARPFFSNGTWPWHASKFLETWFHFAPKMLTIFFSLLVCSCTIFVERQRRRAVSRGDIALAELSLLRVKKLLALVFSTLLCVTVVWWLKTSTGVICPWNLTDFGGNMPFSLPNLPFERRPGVCWPSGAAGSGFCLLPAYFMFRDERPVFARFMLFVAILLGAVAGFARMLSGAHFLSHVISAFFVDWLISASVYVLLFGRKGRQPLASSLPRTRAASSKCKVLAHLVEFISQHTALKLALATSFWWIAFFNAPVLAQFLIRNGIISWPSFWSACSVALSFLFAGTALILLLTTLPRRLFLFLLLALNIIGAIAFTSTYLYGITLTPDMVRNFLGTNPAEAVGYFSPRSAFVFVMALLPALLIEFFESRVPSDSIKSTTAKSFSWLHKTKAILQTLFVAFVFLLVGVLALGADLRGFSGIMRANKALRYQIAPVNIVWSAGVTLLTDQSPDAPIVRRIVDETPVLTKQVTRPTVLAVVVGETARAMNFSLNGYKRNTNPELAKLPIINFPNVTACGTSTDVSLPCMMSRIGRSNYDRKRILSEEQLPSLLSRAGVNVIWIDNQSGCKGACEGVRTLRAEKITEAKSDTGEFTDEVLADAFERMLSEKELPADRPTVFFLHMIGSHGPAYARRSPKERKAFTPECTEADLAGCSRESVVNAYDNSIKETDFVLAKMIRLLQAKADTIDSALLYLSDHGESLGEAGIYLHGAPWWMAPAEQVQVPMLLWLGRGYETAMSINRKAFETNAKGKATHENFYSTVLGLAGVSSTTKRDELDLGLSK